MEYITFMHKNKDSGATGGTEDEWDRFLEVAKESGLFRGGSAIGQRTTIGNNEVPIICPDEDLISFASSARPSVTNVRIVVRSSFKGMSAGTRIGHHE